MQEGSTQTTRARPETKARFQQEGKRMLCSPLYTQSILIHNSDALKDALKRSNHITHTCMMHEIS